MLKPVGACIKPNSDKSKQVKLQKALGEPSNVVDEPLKGVN